jgi:hypothetical protein
MPGSNSNALIDWSLWISSSPIGCRLTPSPPTGVRSFPIRAAPVFPNVTFTEMKGRIILAVLLWLKALIDIVAGIWIAKGK